MVVGGKGGWEAALMSNVLWFGRLPVRRGEQESHRFLVPLHVSLGFEGRLFDTDDKRVSSLRNKVSNALPAVRDGVGWGLDQINLVAFARFVVGGDLGLNTSVALVVNMNELYDFINDLRRIARSLSMFLHCSL